MQYRAGRDIIQIFCLFAIILQLSNLIRRCIYFGKIDLFASTWKLAGANSNYSEKCKTPEELELAPPTNSILAQPWGLRAQHLLGPERGRSLRALSRKDNNIRSAVVAEQSGIAE